MAGTAASAARRIHLIALARPQLLDGLLGAAAVAAVTLEAVAAGVAARRLVTGGHLIQPADDLAKIVPRPRRFDRLTAGRGVGLEQSCNCSGPTSG